MFGIFKSKKPFIPLDTERRRYFEFNMLWLNQEFPEPSIESRNVYVPNREDLPILWDKGEETANSALQFIAENMQVLYEDVELHFFTNPANEIDSGSGILFLESDPENQSASGYYHHKNERGKYEISLDRDILTKADSLVATIAHELAHVKLLGQKGLDDNDEFLTDLTTVFFGFGIFGANSAFQFYQTANGWGHQNQGYLTQEEWAYALALFAFMRYEENPEWSNYLNTTLKSDFRKSLKYLIDNESKIFQFDEGE